MGQEKTIRIITPTLDQITISIDISKNRLDAHRHPARIIKQFDNDQKARAKLIARATPLQSTRIIFEATGAHHRALEMALDRAGLAAVKINPLQTRRFAEAPGKPAKVAIVRKLIIIASALLRDHRKWTLQAA